MLFKDLDIIKPILKALEESGYEKPTEIQKKSIQKSSLKKFKIPP